MNIQMTLTESEIQTATRLLQQADQRLGRVVEQVGRCTLSPRSEYTLFQYLLRSIIYQQLSGKAAGAIWARLCAHYPGRHLGPKRFLATVEARLRELGVSRSKIRAGQDLAEKVLTRKLPGRKKLNHLDDESIINAFTQVHGIGRWTVEMLLIFYLCRPDILPAGDLGIRKGVMVIDQLDALPSPGEVLSRGAVWQPWRTVASWYLWQATAL